MRKFFASLSGHIQVLVPGKKYPKIERKNRDNTRIINDISGIFQGYFRGKTSLGGLWTRLAGAILVRIAQNGV